MSAPPFEAAAADPYPTYRELLAGPRLLPLPALHAWVATRWQDVRRVLGDPDFSADRNRSTLLSEMPRGTGDPVLDTELELFDRILLTLDPPDHTRLRRLVSTAFTVRRVERLAARVTEVAAGLLDDLDPTEEVDLIERFAYPLPVIVISELLGLPPGDEEDLKRWSDDTALLLDPFPGMDAVAAFAVSIGEFRRYLMEHFDDRRRHPRDDLIGALVAARHGDEEALSDDELFAMVVLLVAAGHETTTNLLGNSVVALQRNPDQRRLLQERPEAAAAAVEELVRYDSPVQRTSRVATVATEVGGVRITPGDLLITVLGAANRDPDHFVAPDRLDLERTNAKDHLSFGHGIHRCVGAPLALLEGRIALQLLYRRFPRLEADLSHLAWKPSPVLRGVERLPVRPGG